MLPIPFLDTAFKAIKKQYYDDVADRLNYYYTVLILLFLALIVSAKQYVGQPIQCWVPAQFKNGWEQYAESYCFVQNTYFLPFDQGIPVDLIKRENRQIGYYQWVPIVLAVQACMFYLPNMIWKWFNGQSGIDVKAILGIATDSVGFDPEKRQKNVRTLARYIEDTLAIQSSLGGGGANYRYHQQRDVFLIGRFVLFDRRRFGSYLCCLYLFVKSLFLINVVGQLFLLNSFLGTNYTFWGAQILSDLANGREWSESGHFPRVTMCDFVVRELGQTHTHTIQCVLVINMFNEKIYLFIWFWLLVVGSLTAINLIWWLWQCRPTGSRGLVFKYLRISDQFNAKRGGDPRAVQRLMEKFVSRALRPDGVLLLRFISGHAGDLVTTELTGYLYEDYMDQQGVKQADTNKYKSSLSSTSASTPLKLDTVDTGGGGGAGGVGNGHNGHRHHRTINNGGVGHYRESQLMATEDNDDGGGFTETDSCGPHHNARLVVSNGYLMPPGGGGKYPAPKPPNGAAARGAAGGGYPGPPQEASPIAY